MLLKKEDKLQDGQILCWFPLDLFLYWGCGSINKNTEQTVKNRKSAIRESGDRGDKTYIDSYCTSHPFPLVTQFA